MIIMNQPGNQSKSGNNKTTDLMTSERRKRNREVKLEKKKEKRKDRKRNSSRKYTRRGDTLN